MEMQLYDTMLLWFFVVVEINDINSFAVFSLS